MADPAQTGPAGSELVSINPATGARLGSVPITAPDAVQAVVDGISRVQPFWAALTLRDRARYLERVAQVVIDEQAQIRDLIVREQGKPRNEAFTMELLPTIDAVRWLARAAPGVLAGERVRVPPLLLRGQRARSEFLPLGVVGVIAPWHLPWRTAFTQVAMALIAGNGVVLKPSRLTPLTGERIVRCFERAGVPEGLLRTVHGPGTGAALVGSSVRKVFFTGSAANGWEVSRASAEALRRPVLELGGKDPMIVLADADLDRAVAGCLWAGFANAGQSRSGVERVYVSREVADRFITGLVTGARRLRVGDPMAWETEIGPLISGERYQQVSGLVDDAVAAGAELRCGGPVPDAARFRAGHWFAPAVLTGVRQEMRIMREEVFGPVVPVVVVDSEDEAVALANDSPFGLGASVWTRDRERGELIARELAAGTVWINDHLFSHGAGQMPRGALKASGVGHGQSRLGLLECVDVKLQVWDPSRMRRPWWHPYDETLGRALAAGTVALYGRPSIRLGGLRDGARPLARVAARMLRGAL